MAIYNLLPLGKLILCLQLQQLMVRVGLLFVKIFLQCIIQVALPPLNFVHIMILHILFRLHYHKDLIVRLAQETLTMDGHGRVTAVMGGVMLFALQQQICLFSKKIWQMSLDNSAILF